MVEKSAKKRNRVYPFKHTENERRAARCWYNMWSKFGGVAMIEDGIHVAEIDVSWRSLEVFLEDMGEKPDRAFLCRRNRHAPYGPENCYWGESRQFHCANKKRGLNSQKAYKAARMLLRGKTVREIAEELNVSMPSVYEISCGRTWKGEMRRAKMKRAGLI